MIELCFPVFCSVTSPPNLYTDDLPISPQLTTFELELISVFDVSFLGRILDCMPNLRQFTVTVAAIHGVTSYISDVLDGFYWRDVLSRSLPDLLKFEFLICVNKIGTLVNLSDIINSFEYCQTRFNGWQMVASRWLCDVFCYGKPMLDPSIRTDDHGSLRRTGASANNQLSESTGKHRSFAAEYSVWHIGHAVDTDDHGC